MELFDKNWFEKYQKLLLWLANTWFGRRLLSLNGDRSSVSKNKIVRITPNAIFWKAKGKRQFIAEFRTHDKFRKRIYFGLLPLWKLFHTWDMLWYPRLNLGFDSTGDLFPAAGANSPVDGYTQRDGVDENFATIRAGAGTNGGATDTVIFVTIDASTNSDQYIQLYRGHVMFDTSSIGAASTVESAIFSGFYSAKDNGLGTPQLDLCASTAAATNALVASDYGQTGSTEFGNISYAAFTAAQYNNITLNADGKNAVSKTSITKLALRLHWDLANTTVGLVWSSSAASRFTIVSADETGTSNDPKLVVTYTLPRNSYSYFM